MDENLPESPDAAFPIERTLALSGHKVICHGILDYKRLAPLRVHLEVRGGLKHSQFLCLEYWNSETGGVELGYDVLQLDSQRRTLTGRSVAYDPQGQNLTTGNIRLTKVA